MTRRLRAVPAFGGGRYGIAVRVSRVGGRGGDSFISPDVQEATCRQLVARLGGTVVAVFTDLDVSGGTDPQSRPGLGQALAMVKAGDLDGVAVYDLSRFSRDTALGLRTLQEIAAAGGHIVSAGEQIDLATPGGTFATTVQLAAAQLRRDEVSRAWRATHDNRLARGLPHAGYARLGYRYARGVGYTPDPDTAPHVEALYRLYLDGGGRRRLVDYADQHAITSPRTGRSWSVTGLILCLDNGFAAGLIHTNGEYVPGAHQPIISADLWEAYRRARQRRRTVAPRHVEPSTWLSGLVVCGGCGATARVKADKRYGPRHLYVCEHRGCDRPIHITRAKVEQAVLDELAVHADEITARARTVPRRSDEALRADRKRLAKEATRLDQALGRLTELLADGTVTRDAYRLAETGLREQKARVDIELGKLLDETRPDRLTARELAGLLADWDTLALSYRRAIAQQFITAVAVARGAVQKRPQIVVVPAM